MKRRQLFEFGDQPWLNGWLRDAYLDGLNLALRTANQYRDLYRPFRDWVARAGNPKSVLDLGSGGGGPVETLIRNAGRKNVELPKLILSDLYPSTEHYRRLAAEYGDRIDYVPEPVSATAVSRNDIPLRSFCSMFHHFPPETARQAIRDAALHSDGFFIVEPFERNLRHFLLPLLGGLLLYMISPFFAEIFSFRKLLVCTLLPVVPCMLLFDACVSVLRTYTAEEILAMFPDSERSKFDVQSGTLPYFGFFHTTFLHAVRRK